MKMSRIGNDSMSPNFELLVFNNNADETELYVDLEEELLPKIPEPRGRVVSIYSFVDDTHAGNVVKRRPHT